MIEVKIIRASSGVIKHFSISGHAYADNPGFDLVCAGISCIGVGGLNAINELIDDEDCRLVLTEGEDPLIEIHVLKGSECLQTILDTLRIQCETMEISYGDYLSIQNEMED